MKNNDANNFFSERIEFAINIAAKAHETQHRKSMHKWPYISHCYNVAMILVRSGFSDDVIIAGILHDILEDTDYDVALIEKDFGHDVRKIVEAVTQPADMSFLERKKYQLNYLKTAPIEVKAVKAADKLHNLYSKIVLLREKDNILGILDSSTQESLDGYKEILRVLNDGWDHPILEEFQKYIQLYEVMLKEHGH